MEKKKNVLVMKEKNEEILKFWRNMGLLMYIEKGSQNEWCCAKSFDLMARFLYQEGSYEHLKNGELFEFKIKLNDDTFEQTSKLFFPIIRRLLCVERPMVERIIHPEEICVPFTTVTLNEAIGALFDNGITPNKVFLNLIEYYQLDKSSFNDCYISIKEKNDLEMLRQVFNIDIEAEIIVLFSKYMAVKKILKK